MTREKLEAALRSLWAEWPAVDAGATTSVPTSQTVGTGFAAGGNIFAVLYQSFSAEVPTFPPFPPSGEASATAPDMNDGDAEERAAILEHDAGLRREEAERLAGVRGRGDSTGGLP